MSRRPVQIMGHRGAAGEDVPENTLASFQRALELGADGVELDIRLSRDHVPIVHHDYYLETGKAGLSGIIPDHPYEALRSTGIPSLREVLESFAGRLILEIEVKGPEPEAAGIIGDMLHRFSPAWDMMEVTSFEPLLISDIAGRCAGLATALLIPPSEPWMGLDVVEYLALHRVRLARAQAVHLDPSQVRPDIVARLRQHAIDVHLHAVNSPTDYDVAFACDIGRVETDQLRTMLALRSGYRAPSADAKR